MSETDPGMSGASVPAAAAAPAAPQTTEAITAGVIEQLDAADTSEPPAADANPRVDTTDVTATPEKTAPSPPTPPKDLSVEEQLLAEFGFKDARRPDGREHYIPRSKVLQMIGSGLKRGQARWDGERTALETTVSGYDADRKEMYADILGEPRAFLAKLSQYDPRYKAFLEPQPAAAAPAPAVTDRPKPDVDLGNGQWTYSVEGVEKLTAWKAAQLLDERFKPFEERDKAAQARQAQDKADRELRENYADQMAQAQEWPLFGKLAADNSLTPFQREVLDELRKDSAAAEAASQRAGKYVRPSMTLRGAYLEVHARQLAADDTTKRAQWMDELNAAPRSTSVTRSMAEPTRPRGARSTEEITREVVERLERGA